MKLRQGPDPYGEFETDEFRIEAVRSKHRRDVWIAALLGTALVAAAALDYPLPFSELIALVLPWLLNR